MNKSSTRSAAPHEILGVARNATAQQVKSAYRKLSLQLHPDKNPHNREWATAKFKELNAAYEIMVRIFLQGSPLAPPAR
jgi:curved DNA-binding protein CbpA